MQSFKRLLAAAAILSTTISASAVAEIKIGVITSSTGPMSLIGIPQSNTVALLPTEVAGQQIRYIAFDDKSDTTSSVTSFKKLVSENQVDAVIGPSGTPNAMSLIQFAAESKTPLLTLVGGASVVMPMTEQKKWVFKPSQNDEIIASALVQDMAERKVKTLAIIGTADSFGEHWIKVMEELTSKRGIKIVAREAFKRGDTSVTGQSLQVLKTRPDAVLVAAPGGAAVLPQATLVSQGYKGQMYQTHGAAMEAFLKLGGRHVEGTILAASLMLVIDEVPDSHPSKSVAMQYIHDYKQRYGEVPATFGASVYDAGLLLQHAIPAALKDAAPGTPEFRTALRNALENTHELAGAQGVYNMTGEDHSGFDERGRVLITVKDGQWRLASMK